MAMQVAFCVITIFIQSYDTVSLVGCQIFYGAFGVMWQTLMLSLELSLKQRVLSLCRDQPRISTTLNILTVLEFTNGVAFSIALGKEGDYHGACLTRGIPPGTVYYVTPYIIFQAAWWAIAAVSCKQPSLISSLVLRDTSSVFNAVFAYLAFALATIHTSNFPSVSRLGMGHPFQILWPIGIGVISMVHCSLLKIVELRSVSGNRGGRSENLAIELQNPVNTPAQDAEDGG